LKLQTERLEKNTARLTVEVEVADLERAQKAAATKLSNRYKIPGFRKGKAPYNIVVKFLGEAAILEEAVEVLADEVYPKALKESGLRPYANGTLENFTLDPQPTYTFTLPLQAEVTLGDYRSVRVDYEAPTVTEEMVDRTMDALRQQEAQTTDVEGEIEVGHRITIDLHSHFADGEEFKEDDDNEEEHDHDHDDEEHDHDHDHEPKDFDEDEVPFKGDEFMHQHAAAFNLTRENEPILPGFIDQVVGKKKGDVVEFDLVVPTDHPDYPQYKAIAGRTVHFEISINKVQSVELKELDDAFAQKLTEKEENPLTLEALRARVKENMQREAEAEYESDYADDVLDEIIDMSEVTYPDLMVDSRVEEMVEDFKGRLKQQNITFDIYKSVTGITEDSIKQQYRPDAEKFLTRSLVLGEVMLREKMTLTNDELDEEVNALVQQYGNSPSMRTFFNSKEQRESLANRLLYSKLMDHLTKIGKGEATQVLTEGTESAVPTADND
jgi:trigger factor